MILQGARSLGVEGMERLIADLKAAILSALAVEPAVLASGDISRSTVGLN